MGAQAQPFFPSNHTPSEEPSSAPRGSRWHLESELHTAELLTSRPQPFLLDLPGTAKKTRLIVPTGGKEQAFLRKARRGLRGRVERRRRKLVTEECLPMCGKPPILKCYLM